MRYARIGNMRWGIEFSKRIAQKAALQHLSIQNPSLRLIRLGENAIYLEEATNLIFRVYRSPDKTNTATKCLNFSIHPARPSNQCREVLHVETYPVTVWNWADDSNSEKLCSWWNFEHQLKKLHNVALNYRGDPPKLHPTDKIRSRLDEISRCEPHTTSEMGILERAYENCIQIDIDSSSGDSDQVIHADAHWGNTICTQDGLILIDFDNVYIGPAVWDLAPTATAIRRLSLSRSDFDKFLDGYGTRPSELPCLDDAMRVKELSMISWLCQNRGTSKDIDEEIMLRLYSLKENNPNKQRTIR